MIQCTKLGLCAETLGINSRELNQIGGSTAEHVRELALGCIAVMPQQKQMDTGQLLHLMLDATTL